MTTTTVAPIALLDLKNVKKTFRTPDRRERTVLEGVDFRLAEGEIVALLGKSGSGKSTLLRIMAGLTQANGGDVLYRGEEMRGPARGISMVFQSFALFPWLTVQENVELGLEALGVPSDEREERANEAIEMGVPEGLALDYARAFLSDVNWYEIAQAMIEAYADDEETETCE